MYKMNANQLKVKFIEFLINKYHNIVIGNEVLFSENRCRADIVMFYKEKIYAFEIKSDSDNFADIDTQLLEYITTFQYTYLILTKKHEKIIESLKKFNIGIYIYDGVIFNLIKKPKLSKSILKDNLVEFLGKKDLISLLNLKAASKLSVYSLRKKVSQKCSKKALESHCYMALKERYSKLYNLFLSDVNKDTITIEDLTSLTGNITTDILY